MEESDMLTRLAVYGRAFMERLEEPAMNRKQQRRTRKTETVAAAAFATSMEFAPPDDNVVGSDDEAEDAAGEVRTEPKTDDGGRPSVVIVDATKVGSFSRSAESHPLLTEGRKAFLSSKISKLSGSGVRRPPTAADLKEDEEDRKNDADLMSILEATKFIENYTAEQLTGKARRGWVAEKAVKLGMKEPPKPKRSLSIGLGMKRAQRKRDVKKLEEAKELGLYHKSLKHMYAASGKPKKKGRPRKEGDRRPGQRLCKNRVK